MLEFLQQWKNGEYYFAVDNWATYPGMPWDREGDFRMACIRAERYGGKVKIVRGESGEIASQLPGLLFKGGLYGTQLGFAYIDASHKYEDVRTDIEGWWPLLREGGILAGHDFCDEHPGVVQAVTEFAHFHILDVYTTQDKPESWYVYKGGIPESDWKRC